MPFSFSVVITTYNRSVYVLETVRSVIEQSYKPHEVIVVIDGSTDGTVEAIKLAYPGVLLVEQPNLGRSVARNTGVALATGDWVCFLDDDDLWLDNKLEKIAQYIKENPDCQAINNPVWFFTDGPEGPKEAFGFKRDFVAKDLSECLHSVAMGDPSENPIDYLQIKGNSFRSLLECNRGVMSASVIRRDIVIRAGCFCPMQSYGEDWTMFVNVARLCEWHTLPQRLGFSRLHHEQSSNDAYNAIIILTGQVNAWYTGRPLPNHIRGLKMLDELRQYGPYYRQAVQSYYWGALRARNFHIARIIRQVGLLLLPNRADRIYAMTPPQITWRWEHHVLGKHK